MPPRSVRTGRDFPKKIRSDLGVIIYAPLLGFFFRNFRIKGIKKEALKKGNTVWE